MRTLKYIIIHANGLPMVLFGFLILAEFGFTCNSGKPYSRADAINNFFSHKGQIVALTDYFHSIVPSPTTNRGVSFGFAEDKNRFNITIFLLDGSVLPSDPSVGGHDLKFGSPKMDSILEILKWNKEVVNSLQKKLIAANCENIQSKDESSLSINFRYSGLGLFSYLIFSSNLPDSSIEWYNQKGDSVLNKNVVLIYRSSL